MCVNYRHFTGRVIEKSDRKPESPKNSICPFCKRDIPVFLVRQDGTVWGGTPAPNWFVYLQRH